MKYTSIFERIGYLFNLIKSSSLYISFIVLLVILLILFFTKVIKKNKFRLIFPLLYLLLFLIIIFNNFSSMGKVFDNLSTNFFNGIYFPSVYVYLFVLVVINVVTIISILNIKVSKIYRVVNIVFNSLMGFIFAINMEIVAKNDIDLFSKSSVFTNDKLLAMLELSINLFVLWIIVNVVIFAVNNITIKIESRKTDKILDNDEVIINNNQISIDVANDDIQDDYINDAMDDVSDAIGANYSFSDLINQSISNDSYVDNLVEVNNELANDEQLNVVPEFEVGDITVNHNESNELLDTNNLFDSIINNTLPIIKEDKKEERDYTLNDYKIFNNMLREVKMYNLGSNVVIDETLESKLLDKFSNDEYTLFKKMLKSYSN